MNDTSSPTTIGGVVGDGTIIDPGLLGDIRASGHLAGRAGALRERLAEDGYVYLPGFFPVDDIIAARQAIFERLHAVGEIAAPPVGGIFTGASERDEKISSRGEFWRSVSESWALRRVSHGPALHGLMADLLDAPARAQDFIFLRPAGPGKRTHIHCDSPFFTRTTDQVLTAWIALGDVPLRQGPLFIMEGSHRIDELVDSYRGFDVARDTDRKAARDESPTAFAEKYRCRILTNDFGAGDIVIFNMFLLHGALDNVSSSNEVRLSCDVRYQLASAELDPRYFGPNPGGTTGAGYGELVGARALTEAWHIR